MARRKGVTKLEGLEELGQTIERMRKSVKPENVEPIVLKAAKIIKASAWGRAPRGPTGNLQRGIRAKVLKRNDFNNPAPAMVGIDFRVAPHAHLVEFGTIHAAARPFFRPAVDQKGPEAIKMVERELEALLEKAAR